MSSALTSLSAPATDQGPRTTRSTQGWVRRATHPKGPRPPRQPRPSAPAEDNSVFGTGWVCPARAPSETVRWVSGRTLVPTSYERRPVVVGRYGRMSSRHRPLRLV